MMREKAYFPQKLCGYLSRHSEGPGPKLVEEVLPGKNADPVGAAGAISRFLVYPVPGGISSE